MTTDGSSKSLFVKLIQSFLYPNVLINDFLIQIVRFISDQYLDIDI